MWWLVGHMFGLNDVTEFRDLFFWIPILGMLAEVDVGDQRKAIQSWPFCYGNFSLWCKNCKRRFPAGMTNKAE